MPIYLLPGFYVEVPLETIYQAAWATIPRRWQPVVEGDAHPT